MSMSTVRRTAGSRAKSAVAPLTIQSLSTSVEPGEPDDHRRTGAATQAVAMDRWVVPPNAEGGRRGPPVRRWPRPRVSALLHNPTHVFGQQRVNARGGQRGAIQDVVAVVDTGYVMMFTQHPGPLESAGVAHGLVAQRVVLGRDHDSRCHP